MESTPEAYASFRTFPVMAGWGQETAHATRTVSGAAVVIAVGSTHSCNVTCAVSLVLAAGTRTNASQPPSLSHATCADRASRLQPEAAGSLAAPSVAASRRFVERVTDEVSRPWRDTTASS